MAVRRKRGDDDDGGLDSLLDTMTNVVGILVLVLIVTQLSVKDVVQQVMSESKVDVEDLEKIRQELAEKREEADELERIMVSPLEIDAEKQKEELQKKKELLERQRKLMEQKQKERNQFAAKMKDDEKKAQENKKSIEETEAKRKELEAVLTQSLGEKASLAAQLSRTPRRAAPADIKVSIPNPRAAPPGSKPVPLVCVENKVYPVNLEFFQKRAELRAKEIIARGRFVKDPIKGYDPVKFAKFWEQLRDQDDYFDVEYFVAEDRYLRLRCIPRSGRGGTDRQLINPRSKIRSMYLNKIDPTKYYARFYVLPDSYDVYIKARRLFDKSGLLTGWDPQTENYQFTTWVPGGIELGPPIQEEPPDQRKPAKVID
jgi:hypothetical protein